MALLFGSVCKVLKCPSDIEMVSRTLSSPLPQLRDLAIQPPRTTGGPAVPYVGRLHSELAACLLQKCRISADAMVKVMACSWEERLVIGLRRELLIHLLEVNEQWPPRAVGGIMDAGAQQSRWTHACMRRCCTASPDIQRVVGEEGAGIGGCRQLPQSLQERDMQIGIVDKIAAHDQVEGAEKHSMKLAPLPAKCMREMREM